MAKLDAGFSALNKFDLVCVWHLDQAYTFNWMLECALSEVGGVSKYRGRIMSAS